MERRGKFVEGEFYHVYNRGVEKRVIFKNASDYKRFLALLYLVNSDKAVEFRNNFSNMTLEEIFNQKRGEPLVAIGAYCLMPNHFHLLLTPLMGGGISKFMLKLQTGYSMYFNKKNERVGSLLQGTFKSQHVDNDIFLRYLFAYIHLNPAKLNNSQWKTLPKNLFHQIKKFIFDYTYSSLQEFISGEFRIVNPKLFPINIENIRDYDSIVDDFREEKEEDK